MKPLELADRFHAEAAKGWLDLGNPVEAKHELERVSAASRSHPEVLRIRWRIQAQARDWNGSLRIARRLKATDPLHRSGWLQEAQSLEQLGRASAARQVILSAIERFGASSTLSLQMAHLSAAEPRTSTEALDWMTKAVDLAPDQETMDLLRLQVLRDPTLEPMWTELQKRVES